jgi:hypothetical protein
MPRTGRVVLPEYQGNINLFLFDFKGFSPILERVGVRGTKCHEWRYFAPSPCPSPGGRGDPSFDCIRRFYLIRIRGQSNNSNHNTVMRSRYRLKGSRKALRC